ncbi:HAD-IIIC family phosphatase [Pelomonas cellulosilytica]|uniref:HAD-IIIC family phosphatase n=1 Tax=Pelomonas cellulosilytica TaxID=2906762 RepID=A0ABS8XTP4_9BURK|nr:HAD-IIIC family phosphatase [Pelomonas sp. P8]MCE4556089.1 HAD-IIIC family phosphatase [Pelomonas sp. P8]
MLLEDDSFAAHAAHMKGEFLRTPLLDTLPKPEGKKALIIGSCLANYVIRKDLWCASDLLLFNGGALQDISGIVGGYDFVLVQVPLRAILRDGELWHTPYAQPEAYEAAFEQARMRLQEYLAECLRGCADKSVFVTNFLVPVLNPMGKLLPKYDLRNLQFFIQQLNVELERLLQRRGAHNSFVLDADAVAATLGKRFTSDEFFNALNHAAPGEVDELNELDVGELEFPRLDPLPAKRLHWELHDARLFGRMLSHELQAMFMTLTQPTPIKLIVTDLDNTLWRGVLSEEANAHDGRIPERVNKAFYNNFGVDDGSLYRLAEGFPYGITEALHYCKQRGILLAIISKNSHDDTVRNLERVYAGKLRLDSFVSVKINWDSKAENMRQILQEVNLLPDNVLFLDDNPVERELMHQAFPKLKVMGKWIMYAKSTLHHSVLTEVPFISNESSQRTEMLRTALTHRDEYEASKAGNALDRLEIAIQVAEVPADPAAPAFARAVELLNKTNQFNLNGLRTSAADLQQLQLSGCRLFSLHARDKFTEHGLVGFALVNPNGILVQWAISCRVLGLQVERSFLNAVMRRLGLPRLVLHYVSTDKNFPLTTWLKSQCTQDGGLHTLPLTDDPGHVHQAA